MWRRHLHQKHRPSPPSRTRRPQEVLVNLFSGKLLCEVPTKANAPSKMSFSLETRRQKENVRYNGWSIGTASHKYPSGYPWKGANGTIRNKESCRSIGIMSLSRFFSHHAHNAPDASFSATRCTAKSFSALCFRCSSSQTRRAESNDQIRNHPSSHMPAQHRSGRRMI